MTLKWRGPTLWPRLRKKRSLWDRSPLSRGISWGELQKLWFRGRLMQWRRGVETTHLVQRALPEPEVAPPPTGPTEAWKRAMELAAQKAALRAARAAQPLPISLGGNATTLLRRSPSDSADPTFLDRRGRMGRGGEEEEVLPHPRSPGGRLSDPASSAPPPLRTLPVQTKTVFVQEDAKSRHRRLTGGLPAPGEGLRAPPRPPPPAAESPQQRHRRLIQGLPEGIPSASTAVDDIREATPGGIRGGQSASSSSPPSSFQKTRLQRGAAAPGSRNELPSWTAGRFRGMVLRTEQALLRQTALPEAPPVAMAPPPPPPATPKSWRGSPAAPRPAAPSPRHNAGGARRHAGGALHCPAPPPRPATAPAGPARRGQGWPG